MFYCGLEGLSKRNVGEKEWKNANQIPTPTNAGEFSVFATQIFSLRPTTRPFPRLGFRDNYTAPGTRRPLLKELPEAEEIHLVSDAIRETIV
ncbi:hypothetical protein TNCV_2517191 [Trichonephila clavipes]|nr:hypothetical protein TNCV_2517191 [Trichonephila clavipes]